MYMFTDNIKVVQSSSMLSNYFELMMWSRVSIGVSPYTGCIWLCLKTSIVSALNKVTELEPT